MKPPLKKKVVDRHLTEENVHSVADSLELLFELEPCEQVVALIELRHCWRRDVMGAASLVLKQKNKAAFDRLLVLVLKLNAQNLDYSSLQVNLSDVFSDL